MAVVLVIRSRRSLDAGAVLHFKTYEHALRCALDWQQRHPADRLSIFTSQMEPLASLDRDQAGCAQSGKRTPETASYRGW